MRVMQRSIAGLSAVIVTVALSLLFPSVSGYAQTTPSADQLSIFQSLSPDQQQAVMQQLGGGGTGGALGGFGAAPAIGGARQDQGGRQSLGQGKQDSSVNDLRRLEDLEENQNLNGMPIFKGEDWVVVEIDYHLSPRTVVQTSNFQTGASPAASSTAPASAAPPPVSTDLAAAASAAGVSPTGLGAAGPAGSQSSSGSGVMSPGQGGSGTDQGLTEQDRKRLDDLMQLVRSKNPYRLSREGVLNLPGIAGIPLAGLTDEQATLRLRVEPIFRQLDIRVTRLPLKRTGAEALKPFGYDLFDRQVSTFAPVTNVPVPVDYVVGAGDELNVQMYGNQNRAYRLVVGRDGTINFPELGPIKVGGELYNNVKTNIESRVSRQLIGVHASVSMGDTRAIRVFVLGEVRNPGSYTISGLGTITSALFASGGIEKIGSLRRIELRRQGTLVRRLDLYDLLIRGDTTDDTKLLQGDVIFIPPVGPTASVAGEVRRPAIYEIKNETTVTDLVQLAGGLTPEADSIRATVTRIDANRRRVALRVDLSAPKSQIEGLRNGDLLRVDRLRPTLDAAVMVQGHVFSPGVFEYREGLRLSDVVHSVDELQPNADLHYLLIRRENPPDRRVSVLSADLVAALAAPGSAADIPLTPRDRITVFDLASGRDHIIQPVLDDLRLQANSNRPTQVVHVDGKVKVPGDYPLESGMRVADLVRAGGGLSDAAYGGKAELTRYTVVNGETRRTELINVDLAAVQRGDPTANILVEPFDNLSIKEVPDWGGQESVTLLGEVRFPGVYAIKRGETLRSVINRAGGLSDYSFPEGSVFTREELRRREQQQMDLLANRMQSDLTALALQGAAANQAGAAAALSVGQSLLMQLRGSRAVGRLVIDLPRMMHSRPGSSLDVILRNGDRLIVPRIQQEVTVIGEVQTSTSHLYKPGLTRDDYIALSGGVTRKADNGRIYVVRANGSVVSSEGSRWFQHGASETIKPGDTVVVPLDAERMPALPFWTAVTQIVYNVAIAAAAVHSF